MHKEFKLNIFLRFFDKPAKGLTFSIPGKGTSPPLLVASDASIHSTEDLHEQIFSNTDPEEKASASDFEQDVVNWSNLELIDESKKLIFLKLVDRWR